MKSKQLARLAALTAGFLLTLLLDRALGWAGLPAQPVAYPVAPPNYEVSFERLEYSYVLRANDRGIRYRTIPLAKPVGTRRIVLIGDSFTEGACVEVEQRWSNLIEEQHSAGGALELVNCAEAGTHPPDYLRTLVELGFDYQPDLVLVGLYFDDLAKTPAGFDVARALEAPGGWSQCVMRGLWPHLSTLLQGGRVQAALRSERDDGEPLDLLARARREAATRDIPDEKLERWLAAVPPDMLDAAQDRRISPGLVTHALTRPGFFEDGIGVESERAQRRAAAVARILDQMLACCQERGVELGLVLLPSVHQFDPASGERLMARLFAELGRPVRPEWTTETTGMQRVLASWAEAREVPLCDLVPVFRSALPEATEPLTYAIDPHWTPAGHRVAAEAIATWLEQRGWLR